MESMKSTGTDIGVRLRRIREFRNYTQEYMAGKLDVSQNAYSKMENGITPITTDRLEQLAKVLDVPIETMLNSERNIFNVDNSTIDKFYIENLHGENKEAWQKVIAVLEQQNQYLKDQNAQLLNTIQALSGKIATS